ncbi:MAG TPA: DUF6027 family protein [Egibacteraceae bacterium]|nr:DUF6027 family protein [Egibacteraceae bacterium]
MDADDVLLEPFSGPWDDDDPDANFKREVAEYTRADPMPALHRLSSALGIPVGALARYVLVKWEAEGSEALLSAGPRTVERMWSMIERAESDGSDESRLAAYHALREIIAWLRVPLAREAQPGSPEP